MKPKKQEFYLREFIITTRSSVYDNELMDTQVFINDTFICTIAGCYIGDFVNDMRKLIEGYSI